MAEWDNGTADTALLVPVKMHVAAHPDCIVEVSFEMPYDIKAALVSADFDEAEETVTKDAQTVFFRGLLFGYSLSDLQAIIGAHCGRALPDALYRRFVHRQVAAGNESWAVPVFSMGQSV